MELKAGEKERKDLVTKYGKDIDKGDAAWMLIATALVMLMVPGLALFYGGMVRRKNILATMMQTMVCLAIVGVYWIAIGYALAFGEPLLKWHDVSFLGFSEKLIFLKGYEPSDPLPGTSIPIYLHVLFQGMFAIITPALISGAIAERIRFKPYCLFLILWVTLVYCPLAHCVWAMDWWTGQEGAGTNPVGFLGALGKLIYPGTDIVARSISPAAPSCTYPRALRAWPPYWCCANALAIPTIPSIPIAWCSLSPAPACSGSAGSALTAAAG